MCFNRRGSHFSRVRASSHAGCLIVEVRDHRPPPKHGDSSAVGAEARRTRPSDTSLYYLQEGGRYGFQQRRRHDMSLGAAGETSLSPDGVEMYRLILRPPDEALWNDLRMMDTKLGGHWSDDDVLRIEAQVLQLTAPPLCLAPDYQVTRMANTMLSSTMPSAVYPFNASLRPYRCDPVTGHKLNSVELEQARSEEAQHQQIMLMMRDGWRTDSKAHVPDTSPSGLFVPQFSRLDHLRRLRKSRDSAASHPASSPDRAEGGATPASDAKKAPSAKKKRSKAGDADAPDAKPGDADASRAKAKARKGESSPTDERAKVRRTSATPQAARKAADARAGAGSPGAAHSSPFTPGVALPGQRNAAWVSAQKK